MQGLDTGLCVFLNELSLFLWWGGGWIRASFFMLAKVSPVPFEVWGPPLGGTGNTCSVTTGHLSQGTQTQKEEEASRNAEMGMKETKRIHYSTCAREH